MSKFYINGGTRLEGELGLYSAKNALLPILAGSIISEEEVVIKKITKFSDIMFLVEILENLGVVATFSGDDLHLDLKNASKYEVPEELTKKVRASIFMLGALLSRFKRAKVSYPGGCNIGTRPIDLHLKGLRALNVEVVEEDGFIVCNGENMKAGVVEFSFPSVGATENIMMASVLLKGTTLIFNPAKEPEIVDLQNFLNSMGAKISGAGTDVISVEGVERLGSTTYIPITDRIVAGTYLIAAAATGGKITLNNVNPKHNIALLKHLKQVGAKVKYNSNQIMLESHKQLKGLRKIETSPFPGFATDLQSQFLTMQTLAKGKTSIVENLYETRFKVVPELIKMGANIVIRERTAVVKGVDELLGIEVSAPDLRSGASLVIAGIMAKGETIVNSIENIERGYLNIDRDFNLLGADIKKL